MEEMAKICSLCKKPKWRHIKVADQTAEVEYFCDLRMEDEFEEENA